MNNHLEQLRIKEVKKMLKEAKSAKIQAEQTNTRSNLHAIAKKHGVTRGLISAANKIGIFDTDMPINDEVVLEVLKIDREARKVRRNRRKEINKNIIKDLKHSLEITNDRLNVANNNNYKFQEEINAQRKINKSLGSAIENKLDEIKRLSAELSECKDNLQTEKAISNAYKLKYDDLKGKWYVRLFGKK
jgi:chromosome segregation ATPase